MYVNTDAYYDSRMLSWSDEQDFYEREEDICEDEDLTEEEEE